MKHLQAKQLVLHHVHKIYHTRSNLYIRSNFDLVTDVHDYNDTRHSRFNFNLPERVGSIGNSFYYNAIQHWNSLPNCVKEIENYAHFKRKLKEYLILDSQRREVNDMLYDWNLYSSAGSYLFMLYILMFSYIIEILQIHHYFPLLPPPLFLLLLLLFLLVLIIVSIISSMLLLLLSLISNSFIFLSVCKYYYFNLLIVYMSVRDPTGNKLSSFRGLSCLSWLISDLLFLYIVVCWKLVE